MVRRNYTGVSNPEAEFEALAPAVARLSAMMQQCQPFGPDYVILMEARQALQKAGRHFTGNQNIYSSQCPSA